MSDSRQGLAASRTRIAAAFSPQSFAQLSSAWSELLSKHLAQVEAGEGRVLQWNSPLDNIAAAGRTLDSSPAIASGLESLESRFCQLAEMCLSRGQNLHDPRYIGHQVPPPSPIAGLFDALGTVTNQVMAVYEMGPWATAVERVLVQRWGELLGLEAGTFAGIVTSGGSVANLTALLTARNVVLKDAWREGLSQQKPPVLVVHSDAHYCIARSVGILGLGTDHVVRAPLDERRRMDPGALDELLTRLQQQGQPVLAVVACASATPIGAFDDLNAIADICEKHRAWLHVDAAHGGGVAFSARHRHWLDGLARANSFVCDAHKMLFVPALCAFVFYKNAAHRFETFQQEAPYLFDPSAPGAADYDCGLTTLECTKRAAAFGLWGIWSLFGREIFEDFVDITFATARRLYELLLEADDFAPLHEPQANIVAFRHTPETMKGADLAALGDFNRELRRRLIHSGEYYITQTTLNGAGALRCTVMNPLTDESHLLGLLEAIRRTGRELCQ
jgi:L-2,4-diaminobutyrate decarboxylase